MSLPQTECEQLVGLFNSRRYAELESRARLACGRYPDSGFAWKILGASLQVQGKESLPALRKAAELLPDDAEAHTNLGHALQDCGQFEGAVASYLRALEIAPDFAVAYNNLGNARKCLGQLDGAVASYTRALKIKPDYAEAHSNLGAVLQELGQIEDALASCAQALEINPDFADAHYNLGNILQSIGRLDGAAESYRRALEIAPGHAEAHSNLGNVLKELGQFDGALASYARALESKPDYAEAHSNLLFTLNFHPILRREAIFAACREYDQRFGLPLQGEWRPHGNSRDAGRRLRIGYVSPDFRRHAVAYFAEPIFANHDKSQVEIFCYAEVKREDEYTARFRQFADHWHSTVGLSDDAVAQMIREHRIDILVDLAGHTKGNRLPVFARKPAPVQLTYLGYPGSTGLSAMDYRITDRHADPEGSDAFYSERLLRLPDSLCCYRPGADMPETSILPALARGYLTFGSFNNANKIDPHTLSLWAELLRALPTSRLMILTVAEGVSRARLVQRFAELGIEAQRLEFHGKLPATEFQRKFLEVDIALDPVSVSGGTTTCESLWMGVPVIAWAGERFITRVSYSFLSTAGLGDFAAFTAEGYIRIASHLADNLPLLAEIRAGLRGHIAASPLIDEIGFTRNLENLYREIWGKWCDVGAALPQAECDQLVALFNAGHYAEVESLARQACGRYPDSGFAWKILGAALQVQGKEALPALQKATDFLPDDAEAHNNLGHALRGGGQLDGAVASFRRALEIAPDFAGAHNNLGNALLDSGQLDSALASYARALEIKPDYATAHSNLGNVLHELGQIDRAAASYRRALEIDPGYADAHVNLGSALQDFGDIDGAVASFRRALEIAPDNTEAYSNLLFVLNFHPSLRREAIFAVCQEYDGRFGLPLRGEWRPHGNSREARRRLRIGYVSPDFYRHAVAYFAEPIFANHDKSQVEIFCYAEVKREDEYTARFRQFVDHWHSTVGLSDDAVAQMIREHRIDILVDLAGHTKGNRLPVFARKPAPVQLTYLGYPGSTGLSAMDYRITDRHADPEGSDAFYSERLLRLPDSLWCYRPSADMPEASILPALARGYLTFGSFNNYNKVDAHTLALWVELLKALPASRLMFLTVPEGKTRQRLVNYFAEHGIAAQRLEICGKLPVAEFQRKFLEVDISLDPLNVNGATTTCESLWMGVPVLSLAGNRFLQRAGLSLLNTAGFGDFAVASPGEYIRVAAHLADNLPLLAELRAGLRDHIAASPLIDEAGFTRNLENLYREIWGKWCDAGAALPQAECDQLVTLFNAGRHAEVESLARLACGRYPDSGFAWMLLGASLQMQGKDGLPALQKVTEQLPDNAVAHCNLGNALRDRGQLDGALSSYARAVEINPGYAEAHNNLGNTLRSLGQLDGALASYRRALEINPDFADAYNNLGLALQDIGQVDGAVTSYAQALEIKPDFAEAHCNLGNALQGLGQLDKAVASYRRTLEIKPDLAEAHNNLGNALRHLGQFGDAAASYAQALEIKPDYAEAHYNLGVALQDLGQLDDAVASYNRALEIKPDYVEAYNNLGNVQKSLGQLDSAVASYRRALEIKPDYAEAHGNLGIVLQELGQLDGAAASYRRALEIDPNYVEAHCNLGNALQDIGQLDGAMESYQRALEIKPDYAKAHNNLGVSMQELGKIDDAVASYRRALEVKPDYAVAHSNLLYCLSHNAAVSAKALFAEHGRFAERFEAPLRANWRWHDNSREPERCLQVGIVSADLRNHSVALFIEPLLAHLAGNHKLSLHAYYNHAVEDDVTRRLRGYLTHWHPIVGLSDVALAQKIREDGIDILIDLSGHTAKHRLLTFARKPAPVQVSWIGYPGTTGLSAMDYYLADRHFLPPGQFDSQFTEKLVHLPSSAPFLPFGDAPPVNALPAPGNGYMTFGSFNRSDKLSPAVITLWSRLLRALPNSRMVLGAMPNGENDTLVEWFAGEGIARERLVFHAKCSMKDYLALHHQVDLCLDTFPYNGGTTTNHALWMGVPTLSLAGATVPGRVGASSLSRVGLEAFIARDKMEFVEKGLYWAGRLDELSKIREGLRARFGQSASSRPEVIAATLARALRVMWQRWCAGLPPAPFEVLAQNLNNVNKMEESIT